MISSRFARADNVDAPIGGISLKRPPNLYLRRRRRRPPARCPTRPPGVDGAHSSPERPSTCLAPGPLPEDRPWRDRGAGTALWKG